MRSCILKLAFLYCLGFSAATSSPFHPTSYPKKTAKCKAINRRENVEKEIEIRYVEVNPKAEKTILMVHGWPGLWSNWARQIEEFKNEYHIIAPNHRGFGESTHPGDIETSGRMSDLVGDLTCVLQDAGVDRAVCLGHDWGAQVCWESARMRPDIFEAVAAAVIPYIPANRWFLMPIRVLVWLFPHFGYQQYFQDHTLEAAAELNKDIRRSLRAVYRNPTSLPPPSFLKSTTDFFGVYGDAEIPPTPLLSQEEEDYLVQQYSIQGFNYTLQFYTYGNRYGSWKSSRSQGNYTIPQPALSIYPTYDFVADWQKVEKMLGSAKFLPKLTRATIPAAHWIQLEKPAEFNAVLRNWLNTLSESDENSAQQKPISDEL
ncbi:hypothetical protein ACEPAF_7080 [Sanghuangporus sanghuang]